MLVRSQVLTYGYTVLDTGDRSFGRYDNFGIVKGSTEEMSVILDIAFNFHAPRKSKRLCNITKPQDYASRLYLKTISQ